jgi:hypothetical protein
MQTASRRSGSIFPSGRGAARGSGECRGGRVAGSTPPPTGRGNECRCCDDRRALRRSRRPGTQRRVDPFVGLAIPPRIGVGARGSARRGSGQGELSRRLSFVGRRRQPAAARVTSVPGGGWLPAVVRAVGCSGRLPSPVDSRPVAAVLRAVRALQAPRGAGLGRRPCSARPGLDRTSRASDRSRGGPECNVPPGQSRRSRRTVNSPRQAARRPRISSNPADPHPIE